MKSNFTQNAKQKTQNYFHGGLAQLARALDLHSRGQEFDSPILHIDPQLKDTSSFAENQ